MTRDSIAVGLVILSLALSAVLAVAFVIGLAFAVLWIAQYEAGRMVIFLAVALVVIFGMRRR